MQAHARAARLHSMAVVAVRASDLALHLTLAYGCRPCARLAHAAQRRQVRAEDGARMVALLDRDASDDIDYDEFRRFVCLLPQARPGPACARQQERRAVHVSTGAVCDQSCNTFELPPLYLGGLLARWGASVTVQTDAEKLVASVDACTCHTKICRAVQAQIASPTRIIRDWIDCSDWCGHAQGCLQKPASACLRRGRGGGWCDMP
jgi:hypothetical protein